MFKFDKEAGLQEICPNIAKKKKKKLKIQI